MTIAVCINHVPDTAVKINIGEDHKSISQAGVTYILNPYDEFAVEEALKTKEKLGGGDVVVICVGGESSKESIRKALSMGADTGVLIKDDNEKDSFRTAKILADEIKSRNAQLVFMGKQSIDYDNGVTGQLTAEFLDYNCISSAITFVLEGNKVTAEREIEGGREIMETSLPAVITAQKGLNEPRYASLKGIMAAKKKVIEEKTPAGYPNHVETVKLKKPEAKKAGRIIGSDASAVPELVRLLKEEAKVI